MERLIEKIFLGRTSSGAEVYILKAKKPEVIAAVRSDVSTHKVSKKIFGELKSSVDDIIEYFSREENYETAEKLVKRVTASHGDMGEYEYIGIYLKNVSRLTTLIGWIISGSLRKEYMPGTEKSLRYVPIEGSVEEVFVQSLENYKILEKALDLYKRMVASGIPKEDARYILPLSTAAVHLHQNTNFVGLANIYRAIKSENSLVPSLISDVVNEALCELNKEEPILFRKDLIEIFNSSGRGYPVANMFSKTNKWLSEISENENVIKFSRKIDERLLEEAKRFDDHALTFLSLTNRKDSVEGYVAPMSLSAWHQFMRNDTVKQSVESIYDSVKRKDFVIPDSIEGTKHEEEFIDLFNESIDFYDKASLVYGEADSIGVVPNSLKIYVAFDFDGYNSLTGFMRDRTSKAAQWEIRNIAQEVKSLIEKESPDYAKFIG